MGRINMTGISEDGGVVKRVIAVADLKGRAEAVIDCTGSGLGVGNRGLVDSGIKSYIEVRMQIINAIKRGSGLSETDLAHYDGRFRGLPWQNVGYEVPYLGGIVA